MADFTADGVFFRIQWIANSVESLEGRRMRAETRIDEFIADLAKANLESGAADKIAGQLKAKLEGVVRWSHAATADSTGPVFRAALERLTGEPA